MADQFDPTIWPAQRDVQAERILLLNEESLTDGAYVLYWMQASQRVRYNHALLYAIHAANALELPVLVCICLQDKQPHANQRRYTFMLEGIQEVASALADMGVGLTVLHEQPANGLPKLASDAALVVTDRGYMRKQVQSREEVARTLSCALVQVESDVVVPVETVSEKEEYAARTIRPKIHRLLPDFLIPLRMRKPKVPMQLPPVSDLNITDPTQVLAALSIDAEVPPAPTFHGGEKQARKRLRNFIKSKLTAYDTARNDPTLAATSTLSPYLHHGQISPLEVALAVQKAGGPSSEAFLEQLIVRRELAFNFVYYNQDYDSIACLPDWCQKVLRKYSTDTRAYIYTRAEWEAADTHDPAWNAAQQQMRKTGYMSGYMRMYWGKKVLEWSASPEEAYHTLVYLNDKYELDGCDPNGYAGVAWCFGKHDRPWTPRPVFGTIRYMNEAGLRRKFDLDKYIAQWDA